MLKNMKAVRIIIYTCAAIIFAGILFLCFYRCSNPWNAKNIGAVPCPIGYERIEPEDPYAVFLRDLPLKKKGTPVRLYNGNLARFQSLSAGVIDWPVLGKAEQCADVTMRIRAEYLWQSEQYGKINFKTVGGKEQAYSGGASREKFESYLKSVYEHSNTASVYSETKVRELSEIRPGDVLVYPSRQAGRYGHAILVADVSKSKSGKIAILCVEGNTPAREAHIVRNPNPFQNPWFKLKGDEDVIHISFFHFNKNEPRHC